MLLIPISVLATAITILVVAVVVVSKEQKKGSRLFLVGIRGWIDSQCDALTTRVCRLFHISIVSYMYVVHQLRVGLARAIAPQPRRRKQPQERLQFEKTNNHLSSMHDHKIDTALTPAQKKKLRNKKLEERF